jgi:sulfur-oxidizing protein SoxY
MQRTRSVLTRRTVMAGGSIAALAALLAPRLVSASPEQVQAEIGKLYAGKSMAEGKIKLDLPSIAENGLVVPLNFEVESPMTEKDYVKAIHVVATGNPQPGVATFRLTPQSGRAMVASRMRLARTQDVIAIAEQSDGKFFVSKRTVKVTIGGCGG